jgi:hypothetical protein
MAMQLLSRGFRSSARNMKVGDRIPAISVDFGMSIDVHHSVSILLSRTIQSLVSINPGFPPAKVNMAERTKGKKTVRDLRLQMFLTQSCLCELESSLTLSFILPLKVFRATRVSVFQPLVQLTSSLRHDSCQIIVGLPGAFTPT